MHPPKRVRNAVERGEFQCLHGVTWVEGGVHRSVTGSAVNDILRGRYPSVDSGAELARGRSGVLRILRDWALGLIVILRTTVRTGSSISSELRTETRGVKLCNKNKGARVEQEQGKLKHQMTLIKSNGERIKGKFKEGDSILDVVVNNSIDLDGYEKPTDEELDMLDLAYDLTETSRLGCQIILKKEMDGLEDFVEICVLGPLNGQLSQQLVNVKI
uniref:Ferredoxin n=1 Tax=Timema tahoe TaxID=61484 RepID=A0A7R9IMT1_9NEOP|nr:unnamed protein product [Timema tahoe]